MLSGNDIRKSFLDYFVRQGHTPVRSSSLVPENDPTLLFTNAGMVQFKNIFLGIERPSYARAASAQKCLRISGKHNDLEAVGRDTYHHTFFEMLGNWSFGDYYKAEAIAWAWELLTREWGLDRERLWATVYLDDDEAERLWVKITGIPTERILRFGEKENFWEMGETGPCGPCTEIHLDRGSEACDRKMAKGHRCMVNGGCARFIELWNLVFIQYNRNERGELQELPAKHVDTGMGMERITAVLQGVLSNYDIDYMRALIRTAEALAGKQYGASADADVSFRVIADHARAVAFLIADGVVPSNEGRGYVLRRLLRRAARHGRMLGLTEPFLHRVAATVQEVMGDAYPELREASRRVRDTIEGEEQRFAETLEKGLGLLEQAAGELKRAGQTVFPGEIAFRLYDTYGFPLDLTEDMLSAEGMTVDRAGFEKHMEEQRTRAREARQVAQTDFGFQLENPVRFVGYDRLDAESTVLAIYARGSGKPEAGEGEEIDLLTAETPFYGESGGQVGDRGVIETARGDWIEIFDTQHPTPQLTVHKGRVKKGRVQVGDRVHLRVDAAHRQRTKLNHSATHILHAVLRERLGAHVRQAGSLVAPDRLRFDFSHPGGIPPEELGEIEEIVNERIRSDAEVRIAETSYDEAMQKGALAFFGEKYGERVRVVQIGDFSTELCGGTHVGRSGEIGIFKLQAEAGIAAGVRRIEAVTGAGALELIRQYESRLKEISELLRGGVDETAEKVRRLLKQQREMEKEIARLNAELSHQQIPELLKKRQTINGAQVLIGRLEGLDGKQLREIADRIKERMGSGVVVLASATDGNVSLVSSVSKDLTARFHAGNIVKEIAAVVGGGGGGRPDFAQAGGKDPARVDEALRRAEQIIKQAK
ncbi:MAG TPA: alanine--tRNA ligase [Candidatus Acidoferrales bacterium]|nr:alanine--tRNA ligase [Candidatus Acidoferrales bacterium]